jgi:hypothetical protein
MVQPSLFNFDPAVHSSADNKSLFKVLGIATAVGTVKYIHMPDNVGAGNKNPINFIEPSPSWVFIG